MKHHMLVEPGYSSESSSEMTVILEEIELAFLSFTSDILTVLPVLTAPFSVVES